MTVKETILDAIKEMDDGVTYSQAIERLYFLQKLERALKQADEGDVMDHDEFMDQLLNEDEEVPGSLGRRSTRGSQGDSIVHRPKQAATSKGVRKPPKKVRR